MTTRRTTPSVVAVVGLASASLICAAVEGSAATVAADAARPAAAACAWKTVKAPSPGFGAVTLRGVDALGPDNIWAVGSMNAQGATLVEHWNGKAWKVVKSPSPGSLAQLEDVAAISPKNVWAVGYYVPTGQSVPKTLIEHWNGNKWSVVRSPSPLQVNVLFGVDAASAKAVYAVGTNNLGVTSGNKQITLRLARGRWKVVKNEPGETVASDVLALPKGKATVVGHIGTVGSSQALVEELTGGRFVRVAADTSANGADLLGLATSGGARFAVGQRSGGAALQTLALRKTTGDWGEVGSANSGPTQINVLRGVAAVSKRDAWSVGYHETPSFLRRTLIEHYAKGEWKIVKSPNSGTGHNELLDVTATRGDLWAVGFSTPPLGAKAMVVARRC